MKLVAVTGYAKDDKALKAAGFNGYLSKPVDIDELAATLPKLAAAM